MIRVLSLTLLVLTSSAYAAPTISEKDIAGSFIAGKLAMESYYAIEFAVGQDGKQIEFRDATIDAVRPKGDCLGTFEIKQSMGYARVNCKSLNGRELRFEIDLTGVTATSLKAGVKINARSEATRMQWVPFTIQQLTQSFFKNVK